MGNSILFLEKYPFMGVELLNLFPDNYRLLSYYDDDCYKVLKKLNYQVLTYGNNNFLKDIDSDKSIVSILSNKSYLNKIIKGNLRKDKVLLFYMSKEMDKILRKNKMSMVLPPYNIQEKIGNKILLSGICDKLKIEVNKSFLIEKSEKSVSEIFRICSEKLNIPFIVQGGLGVSGEDTFKITSEQELMNHFPRLDNKFRASKFLENNIPISIHVCITKTKIYCEGPYIQLVGFKELTKNPFQFSGNDTNQKILNKKVKNIIFELSLKLSEYAKSEGYRGIMGIDFLWDKFSKKIYVQEINSRLVGLTRLLTGIQKEQKIIPHLIHHINEFLPMHPLNGYTDKLIDLSKNDYAQIYISNNSNNNIEINKYLSPGIYKITDNKLIRTKDSLFLSDMNENEVLINFSAYVGNKLKLGQTIAKIILKKSVLNKNKYALSKDIIKLISLIKNFVIN